jgi:hypothetical protein
MGKVTLQLQFYIRSIIGAICHVVGIELTVMTRDDKISKLLLVCLSLNSRLFYKSLQKMICLECELSTLWGSTILEH